MKKLQFNDLVGALQNCFEEDLLDMVDSEGAIAFEAESPFASYFITQLENAYDEEDTNSEKIDKMYAIIEDTRLLLREIESAVDDLEDNVITPGERYDN
jgi:hypothetical protein